MSKPQTNAPSCNKEVCSLNAALVEMQSNLSFYCCLTTRILPLNFRKDKRLTWADHVQTSLHPVPKQLKSLNLRAQVPLQNEYTIIYYTRIYYNILYY